MKCLCGEEMKFIGWEGCDEQEEALWTCDCGMTYSDITGWWHDENFIRIEEEY